jgi:hypothetical protein
MKRSPHIHERFLRHIWSNQYLRHTSLRTTDGRPVRVLEPGELNLDGGPDFRNAKLKIGNITYAGDVEIHRNAVEWIEHQHTLDARYNQVILHVVLEVDPNYHDVVVPSGRTVPTLVLAPFLSESIHALYQRTILDERARRDERIKCASMNQDVDPGAIQRWLRKLAVERLELKLRRFEERLKELAHTRLFTAKEPAWIYAAVPTQGDMADIPPPHRELTYKDLSERAIWEQVLYEGFMEGLGYNKNQEPFLRLARGLTLNVIRELDIVNDLHAIESLLFGAAGLLPKARSISEKESRDYVSSLRKRWRELRPAYRGPVLSAAAWQFFPTRPTNFPTLRLAAGARLIARLLCEDLFRKMIQTIKTTSDTEALLDTLTGFLKIDPPAFWSHHYSFEESTTKTLTPLGDERIRDIIINSVVPLALLYARTFREREVREHTLRLYDTFPPLMENTLTRMMDRQLVRGKFPLNSVGLQQGAIQLYKYYCREERCFECEVGKIVFAEKR